jgi:hypothetical protein
MPLVPHTSSGGLYGKPQDLISMIIQLQNQVAALQLQLSQCQGIIFISPDGTHRTMLSIDNTGAAVWTPV